MRIEDIGKKIIHMDIFSSVSGEKEGLRRYVRGGRREKSERVRKVEEERGGRTSR